MAAPRTQFYHPAAQIEAGLKGVERCIRRAEGVALVVGAPGTGKSLLLAKVAEHLRDDFDVALLSGASICTRRALWQSVLAAIGEPFRGIDESDLRMAIVERIRGLAATGSGLVILVDEAATLPTRLIEELRLLTNIPTPLPAVHIVLAGSVRLEEMLAAPRMESLAQRVAVRAYLEPLDHAETMAYLRTQMRAAGLAWERLFAPGCDDAVFKATDGVPRLVNQLCDQALVIVAECSRLVTPADIASAWREIQRLPAPSGVEPRVGQTAADPADSPVGDEGPFDDHGFEAAGMEIMEFGADIAIQPPPADGHASPTEDPWSGPDVEFGDGRELDPFAELFPEGAAPPARPSGHDDFRGHPVVSSREGQALGRLLATLGGLDPEPASAPATPTARSIHADETPTAGASPTGDDFDDADMVVIVDDADAIEPSPSQPNVFSVRPADYRNLFSRLRRGDRR